MGKEKDAVQETVRVIRDTGLANVIFGIDTSKLASIKTGGRALCYFVADRVEDLKKMIETCIKNKINFMIVGDCTNILFSDKYINMVLIKLGKGFDYLEFGQKNEIVAGAGCSLSKFVVGAAYEGYDFSDFYGIPGTLGGSVRGNSGSMKRGICDFIDKVKIIENNGRNIVEKVLSLDKSYFGYRHLDIMNLVVITEIVFNARKSDKKDILKKAAEKIREKRIAQPISSRSAGCFFKNVSDCHKSAGQLIEECGLKGFVYGGAKISERHANFIENFKNASSKDIFILSKIAREEVMNKFNKKLEYEVKLVGF